jgi:hypothetical protein
MLSPLRPREHPRVGGGDNPLYVACRSYDIFNSDQEIHICTHLRDKGTIVIGECSNVKVSPMCIRQRDVRYECCASHFQLLPTNSKIILRHRDVPGSLEYIGPVWCDLQTRRLW